MATFCINLNIHSSASKEVWDIIEKIYAEMPEVEWKEWLHILREKLTAALGYPIGEPEDGYEFKYWE